MTGRINANLLPVEPITFEGQKFSSFVYSEGLKSEKVKLVGSYIKRGGNYKIGRAKIYLADGRYYKGMLDESRSPSGSLCKLVTATHSFVGSMLRGLFEGRGTLRFNDGSQYEGPFHEGHPATGLGKLTLPDGSTYEGPFHEGLAQGKGKMTYANGDMYEGFFQNGLKNGAGKMIYADGSEYSGKWVRGVKQGQGKMIYANGDVYEGSFHEDLRQGEGKITYALGGEYSGEWLRGVKQALGKMIYANGDVYEGSFHEDLRQGEGKITYANGDGYTGEWVKDKCEGQGVYTGSNGLKYKGEWAEGRRHGLGTLILPNGDRYIGQFANDNFEGHGVYTFANGYVYEGEWLKGKRHGQMTLIFPDGSKYTRNFTDGRPSGTGAYTFLDGGKYVGQLVNGLPNGKGKETFMEEGASYEGPFVGGKRHGSGGILIYSNGDQYIGDFSEGVPEGKGGIEIYPDGSQFVGDFEYGVPHGKGTYTFSDGRIQKGSFVFGVFQGEEMSVGAKATDKPVFGIGKKEETVEAKSTVKPVSAADKKEETVTPKGDDKKTAKFVPAVETQKAPVSPPQTESKFLEKPPTVQWQDIKPVSLELPAMCERVETLSRELKANLDPCKSQGEAEQRKILLKSGPSLKELGETTLKIARRLAVLKQREESFQPFEMWVRDVNREVKQLIESFSINSLNMQEEIELIQNLRPTEMQQKRFIALLDQQFVRTPIRGEGDCQVLALANGIWFAEIFGKRRTNPEEAKKLEDQYASRVRMEIADYMEKNPDRFQPHIAIDGETRNWKEYLKKIRTPQIWLDEQELRAAAEFYRRPIYIFTQGSVEVVENRLKPKNSHIHGGDYKERSPIYLYFIDGNHYEFLTLRQKEVTS